MLRKIITGGQTGVDIAGLRAAKAAGMETGGYMPKGFKTEDGNRPEYAELYGMQELSSPSYPVRTARNVEAADLTILIATNMTSPGCAATSRAADRAGKRIIYINISEGSDYDLSDDKKRSRLIDSFIRGLSADGVEVVNIAGNRGEALEAPVEAFLGEVFKKLFY